MATREEALGDILDYGFTITLRKVDRPDGRKKKEKWFEIVIGDEGERYDIILPSLEGAIHWASDIYWMVVYRALADYRVREQIREDAIKNPLIESRTI